MESRPQNPEFRINPKNFHPCKHIFESKVVDIFYQSVLTFVLGALIETLL